MKTKILTVVFILSLLIASAGHGDNVVITKHNLSAYWPSGAGDDPRTVKASSEKEICVFCHTPHAAAADVPLWNRSLSYQDDITYTPYSSGSLDATVGQPGGYSKLCLSCHDGVTAIGSVYNAPGSGLGVSGAYGEKIFMTGVMDDKTMPEGSSGEFTGDTRRLGTDLSNDHPISFDFSVVVNDNDGELARPYYGAKGDWNNAVIRLWPNDSGTSFPADFTYVQCSSCHNPHGENYDPADSTKFYPKFLRTNLYKDYPNDTNGQVEGQQICIKCHDKPGWFDSAHNRDTAYDNPLTTLKYRYELGVPVPGIDPDVYAGTGDMVTLGMVGCLNCHDPHTVDGSDRLRRNGSSAEDGTGTASIENTCYQCHISNSQTVPVVNSGTEVRFIPNIPSDKEIKPEFDKFDPISGGSAMPLSSSVKFLIGNDYTLEATNGFHRPAFVSSLTTGKESVFLNSGPALAHVECVDCHNPHQVKNPNADYDVGDGKLTGYVGNGTHVEGRGGRLEGMLGITVDGLEVGRNADPTGIPTRDPYVHEVCLRCHGDSFDDFIPVKIASVSEFPGLANDNTLRTTLTLTGSAFMGPCSPAANCTTGSNKRLEFDPNSSYIVPTDYQSSADESPSPSQNTAFHPVAAPGTNRSKALCFQLKNAFFPALSYSDCDIDAGGIGADVLLGNLTINCTDCHNNDETGDLPASGVIGPVTESNLRATDKPSTYAGTDPVGPHGSENPRLLRAPYETKLGTWSDCDVEGRTAGLPGDCWIDPFTEYDRDNFALCFLCHNEQAFTQQCAYGECTGEDWMAGDLTNFFSTLYGYNINLHASHLAGKPFIANTKVYTTCANCHYNIHSNIEAANTRYTVPFSLTTPNPSWERPTDGGTRLINFSPAVRPSSVANYGKPVWGCRNWSGWRKGCNFSCHAYDTEIYYTPPNIDTTCDY